MEVARTTPHHPARWCLPVILGGLALAISWPLANHFSLVGRHRIALLVAAPAGVAALATTLLCCRRQDAGQPVVTPQISITNEETLNIWLERTQQLAYSETYDRTQREQLETTISRFLLSRDPDSLSQATLSKVYITLRFHDEPLQFDRILRVLQRCKSVVCSISTLNNHQLEGLCEVGSHLEMVTIYRANDLDPDRLTACLRKWPKLENLFLGCVTYPPETTQALEGAGRDGMKSRSIYTRRDAWT
jgi:hypothetical protein